MVGGGTKVNNVNNTKNLKNKKKKKKTRVIKWLVEVLKIFILRLHCIFFLCQFRSSSCFIPEVMVSSSYFVSGSVGFQYHWIKVIKIGILP